MTSSPPESMPPQDEQPQDEQPRSEQPRPSRSWRNLIVLIVAVVIAALVGAAVDRLITDRGVPDTAVPAAPTADQTHAADVRLCTQYATINAAMPAPVNSPLEVLAGVNGLRLALVANPDAGTEIRNAIEAVVANYTALIASVAKAPARGLSEPRPYDAESAEQAAQHVWDVCQLRT